MINCKCIALSLIMLLLAAVTLPVYAGSVHKWVDDQGVTHYSDQAPDNYSDTNSDNNNAEQVEVIRIDFSDAYRTSSYQDNYYSVTNQWARMKEERIERKQLQLEKAKQKVAQQPVDPQVVFVNQAEESQRSIYYPAHSSFGHRGGSYTHKYNRYAGKKYYDRYSGANCELPRSSPGSRYRSRSLSGSSGLTLTIR